MKKVILLVALIAVGCFVASRLLKGDGGSVETAETLDEMTNAEDAPAAEASEGDGQADIESPAKDAIASETAT